MPSRSLRTSSMALAFALACLVAWMPASAAQDGNAVALAVRTLDRMDAGEFDAVVASFTPEAKAAIDAPTLRGVWASLPQQAGAAKGRGEPVLATQGSFRVVTIPLYYEHANLNAIITLDAQDRVAGLLLQPAQAAPPPAAPPADDAAFRERDFSIGDGERALPGTLAMPIGAGPFPAVVLVHGSGPQDRDETIGPNRPFLDIARGLAEQGIAVLRYDKRTHTRPADFGPDSTIDDETTDDAVAAIAALRATPGIDPGRVFVLGHSLGAMMAPRIASRAEGTAGAILFAAPSRPLLDIVVEQFQRMAAIDGNVSDAEQQAIDALSANIARIRGGEDVPAPEAPLGQSTAYWRSIEAVDTVAGLQALPQPALVLHGGRDIQVVEADWQGWQAAFTDSPRVTLKAYPALSHLGIAGEGPGSLADYQTPGQVDATLINDIAAWIKAH